MRTFPVIVLAITALVSLSACGGEEPALLAETEEVVEQLRNFYIDGISLSDGELNTAAIQGILDYIDDPYTSYLESQRYAEFTESLNGESGQTFEGIGAEVSVRNGQLMIVGPLPGSPAIKAGIVPGDLVLKVDGQPTEGLDLLQAVTLIRGPKNSKVVLTILRAGSLRPLDIAVVRDTIELTSVLARMQQDGIGYIRLSAFDVLTVPGMIQAIADLRESGAKGLILDLRNNTGGLLNAAVGVVSEFVSEGLVCTGCNPGSTDDFQLVSGEGSAFELPLVVLVNGFSASASEIVAGALQDHNRATIIGTTTFGKGSVNLLLPLKTGSGLYVTVARWFTPAGQVIEGNGITPDIVTGSNVHVQSAQRLGGLTQSLCAAFEEESNKLAGQEMFADKLTVLCTLEATTIDEPLIDEQLEKAVSELSQILDW